MVFEGANQTGFWHTLPMTDERGQEVEEAVSEGSETEPAIEPAGPRELGGPKGPEPTRYGDWERAGRCIDF